MLVGTLPFRAFEVLAGDAAYSGRADLFSLGMVVCSELCAVEWGLPAKTLTQHVCLVSLFGLLGTPAPKEVLPEWVFYPKNPPQFEKKEWPDHVWQSLGPRGVDLLNQLLLFWPSRRISVTAAIAHEYFVHRLMSLGGCALAAGTGSSQAGSQSSSSSILVDGQLRGIGSDPVDLQPYTAQRRACFRGRRHEWNIIEGQLEPELLEWVQDDPDLAGFLSKEAAFAAGLGKSKKELSKQGILFNSEERKMNCAMDMNGSNRHAGSPERSAPKAMPKRSAPKAMNGLTLTPPLGRMAAFRKAFLRVNATGIAEMAALAKKRALACGVPLGENGRHFCEVADAPESWLFAAGELHVTNGAGVGGGPNWTEAEHQDGSGSILLGALTLYGHRLLCCRQPAGPDVLVDNGPGAFYMGQLTGPQTRRPL